jgi:hypothetical protein
MPSMHPMITRLFLCSIVAAALPAAAQDGCAQFKWDVAHERALFAKQPIPATAGKDVQSAAAIAADQLYELHLIPQQQVAFSVAPKKTAAAGAYAGLARLTLPTAGAYRVSIDSPLWIDIVVNGAALPAKDFEGQHGCSAPHKIVEFDLSAGESVVQLSNAAQSNIRLTVTASPPRTL